MIYKRKRPMKLETTVKKLYKCYIDKEHKNFVFVVAGTKIGAEHKLYTSHDGLKYVYAKFVSEVLV